MIDILVNATKAIMKKKGKEIYNVVTETIFLTKTFKFFCALTFLLDNICTNDKMSTHKKSFLIYVACCTLV